MAYVTPSYLFMSLQFVLYILRMSSETLKPYEKPIIDGIMALLRYCPCPEPNQQQGPHCRKDILNSVRHILASDLRRGFLVYLDDLLEESIFLGPISSSGVSGGGAGGNRPLDPNIRALAYLTMVEVAQTLKEYLAPAHVLKLVAKFSLILHDRTLTMQLHVTVVYLLAALMDRLQVQHTLSHTLP